MAVQIADVRNLLEDTASLSDYGSVADDASLFDANIIDSLRLIEIVAAIEQRFGIKVKDTDLTPQNFDTIQAITAYINLRSAA
jgi:acyl carrier protein